MGYGVKIYKEHVLSPNSSPPPYNVEFSYQYYSIIVRIYNNVQYPEMNVG